MVRGCGVEIFSNGKGVREQHYFSVLSYGVGPSVHHTISFYRIYSVIERRLILPILS